MQLTLHISRLFKNTYEVHFNNEPIAFVVYRNHKYHWHTRFENKCVESGVEFDLTSACDQVQNSVLRHKRLFSQTTHFGQIVTDDQIPANLVLVN